MREILFQISASAVLTAVIKALVPSDKYDKQFRILTSCFFIIALLGIFGSFSALPELTEFFSSETGYNDYSVQVTEQTAEETAKQLRERIRNELAGENIFPEKIYVNVNISDGSNISISEIRLVFRENNEEEAQRAVSLTKKLVGYRTAVIAESF